MMHRCYFLCLLLLLVSSVWSSDSTGRRRRNIPRPVWSTPSNTQADENTQEEDRTPLHTSPIPLPSVDDNDDHKSLFNFKKKSNNKPCFDIISLKAPVSRSKRQNNKSTHNNNKKRPPRSPSGSRFSIDLRLPSPDRITQWFAPGEDGSRRWNKKISTLFNHDSVGMTNPVLGVSSVGSQSQSNMDYDSASSSSASVSLASSTSDNKFEIEDSLIPAATNTGQKTRQPDQEANQLARVLQYKLRPREDYGRQAAESAWFPSTQQQSPTKSLHKKWRQCRYRRRVGQGQACYERVREAALEWQFQHDNSKEGILPVSAPDSSCFSLDPEASEKVQPIWSGPHTGGSRRLVTFTTCGFKTKWLPKLYALNPVMVVYDVLDQRGPATTYTSTAYATLKGHLLSGEERVTVALRDGTGFVDVEILSYSRPGQSVRSKFVWPVIGRMQQRFFQHQMDYLEQVAMPKPPPPPPSTTPK